MFSEGQKVVCIDDKFETWVDNYYKELPKEGTLYVIRGVEVGISPQGEEGEIAVTLIGITNPKSNKAPFRERAFNAMRFRSLDELKDENKKEALEEVTA